MTDFSRLLTLAEAGNTEEMDALIRENGTDGVTWAQKRALTRTAARNGRAAMLRFLFGRHLGCADADRRGRTILHDAAISGDAETAAFALDVLGFDPLAGDRAGETPLALSTRAPRQDAFRFLRGRVGFGPEEAYANPVRRGMYPDPSIVRVGEDYYLVNSSFVLFPGLPVSHSRDLVHWRTVGHAVQDLEASGLRDLPGGYGYWAPDISFYHGRFWVVATLRRPAPPYRLQMITSAVDPRGPWSKPRFLPLDGIDPSLFADEDGRRYILLNPGATLAEISEEGELLSPPEMIYFGSAKVKPEGPHLLKRDGWYYLFQAEGGTGEGHMETAARSRSLKGPYAPCPYNPILSPKQKSAYIQRSGHGKPFMLPDGRWMMVYLCGRKAGGKTVMGRETALDALTWTKDGWPIVNGLQGPGCLQKLPLPPQEPAVGEETDWLSPRNDPASFAEFAPDRITLRCGADPAWLNPCSLLLHRQAEACFTQTVQVDVSDAREGALAGLAGYYDENSFFVFGLRREQEGCAVILLEQMGRERTVRALGTVPGNVAVLSVRGNALNRRLTVVENGKSRSLCAFRVWYLCDEAPLGGKRFTGALPGLAAVGEGEAVFTGYRSQMERA